MQPEMGAGRLLIDPRIVELDGGIREVLGFASCESGLVGYADPGDLRIGYRNRIPGPLPLYDEMCIFDPRATIERIDTVGKVPVKHRSSSLD
jgi:hypothetical protein